MKIAHVLAVVVVVPALASCAQVAVKGRETFRVGPLRGVPVAAANVLPKVNVDAGTDALTDDELAKVEARLPKALAESFDKLANERGSSTKRVGTAHIEGCRLRAGRQKTGTIYEARCKVALVVDDVGVVEVHSEAIVRELEMFGRPPGEKPDVTGRNPALSADESERALTAALDAAAHLVVDGVLPPADDGPPPAASLPREERAELARARLKRGGDAQAALFDIRNAGAPSDASSVLPFLEYDDDAVKAAAVDALGELCAPEVTEQVKAAVETGSDAVKASGQRALIRLKACASLAKN